MRPATLGMLGPLSAKVHTYQPGAHIPRHHHARASLSLILEGEQYERVGPHRYHCPRHSAVLKGSGVEHENAVGPRVTHGLFVEMSEGTEAALCDSGGKAQLGAGCFTDEATRHLVRRIGQELRLSRPGAGLIVEGLVYELLGGLVRKGSLERAGSGDVRLRSALDYLEANYRRRVRASEVARECGIHPSYLAELFRSRQGTSVGEWVRNRRLEFVRDALRRLPTPIADIAFQAGFADQSHLTRLFRARFGVPPAEYRRRVA